MNLFLPINKTKCVRQNENEYIMLNYDLIFCDIFDILFNGIL